MKYFFLLVILSFVLPKNLQASSSDWYTFYVQCVASSTQEATCYQSIQEYLATEEGRKEAEEMGFKRSRRGDQEQVASQTVVITNRIQRMETYLTTALETAQEEGNTVRAYCLLEKQVQMKTLKKSAEEKKDLVLKQSPAVQSQKLEESYQALLSYNSLANDLYRQARKCLE